MRAGERFEVMDYVVAVQAPARRLADGVFVTESAFAEHLKELRQTIGSQFEKLVLLAPTMPDAQYEVSKDHLGRVELARDGIAFVPLHPADVSKQAFWLKHAREDQRQIERALANAGIVQSGMVDDIYRPMMAMINLTAWWRKIPVVFVVDIDFRHHTIRNYQLGVWGRKSYLSNKLMHDPLRSLQVRLAPRMFQLVLLKSASMVRDFGHGRSNVKNFYDTVHSASDVLSATEFATRKALLLQEERPLEFVYFGRFVAYKGLERAVEAVHLARQRGANVRLTLIGAGECIESLRAQVESLGLRETVRFEAPVRYGAPLFERLGALDVAINTPLREDTPRSAFDAMARGLPVLAFDITYFSDLAEESGAVALATWPDPASLADQMVALAADRPRLVRMAQRALDFAERNTQTEWIARRTRWVLDVAAGGEPPIPKGRETPVASSRQHA
jgi:glycosyltransferase involved in cell wall biosynthesis